MADIMGLFACCSQCLERPPIRRLRRVGEALAIADWSGDDAGHGPLGRQRGGDRTLPRFYNQPALGHAAPWVLVLTISASMLMAS